MIVIYKYEEKKYNLYWLLRYVFDFLNYLFVVYLRKLKKLKILIEMKIFN